MRYFRYYPLLLLLLYYYCIFSIIISIIISVFYCCYYYWLSLHLYISIYSIIYISIYSFMKVIWRRIIPWKKTKFTISRCLHDMNPLLNQAARNPYWTLIWARPRLRHLAGWHHRFPKPCFCGLWLIWEYHVLKLGPVMIVGRKNGTHQVGVLYSQRPLRIQANKPVNSHRPSAWAKCIVRTRRQVAWKMAR